MLKRSHYLTSVVVVLATLIILNLPNRLTTRLKLFIGSLFLPLAGLAQSSERAVTRTGEAFTSRNELQRQNEAYRHENQELRQLASQAESLERENARLRQLLGWQQRQRMRLRLGKVILREPSNWWLAVEIDLGSRDGMITNRPVLSADGYLVGRISSVRLTRSQVLLLGNPDLRVPAMVDNDTRDMGVIGPSSRAGSGLVELGFLSRNANLKPGQTVRTSGQGGILPRDLLIGQVVDSQSIEYGLGTLARVQLAAKLEALDEVWVVIE